MQLGLDVHHPGASAQAASVPLAGTFLADALRNSWRRYRKNLKPVSKSCTEEAVHDFRVSIRRLLATLSLLHKVSPEIKVTRFRKKLRKQLRSLGPLRDLHIQMNLARELGKTIPKLDFFYKWAGEKEKKASRLSLKRLRKIKMRRLKKFFLNSEIRILALLEKRELHHGLLSCMENIAEAAFQKVESRIGSLVPDDPSSVHKLRVAFKDYRYTTEILQPLGFGITEEKLKNMQAFQGKMGEIQDLAIFHHSLESAKTRKKSERGAARKAAKQVGTLVMEKTRALVESAGKLADLKPERQEHLRLVVG